MKKLLFILLIVFAFAFVGCKEDPLCITCENVDGSSVTNCFDTEQELEVNLEVLCDPRNLFQCDKCP